MAGILALKRMASIAIAKTYNVWVEQQLSRIIWWLSEFYNESLGGAVIQAILLLQILC